MARAENPYQILIEEREREREREGWTSEDIRDYTKGAVVGVYPEDPKRLARFNSYSFVVVLVTRLEVPTSTRSSSNH